MKLYVDDIRNAPNDTWITIRSVTGAIRIIDQFYLALEEISLDHDISHQVIVGSISRPFPCMETFMPVAQFIRAKYLNQENKPKITIHTSNPVGAKAMEHLFDEAGFVYEVKMMGLVNRLEMEAN